jgi:hypothetical protein
MLVQIKIHAVGERLGDPANSSGSCGVLSPGQPFNLERADQDVPIRGLLAADFSASTERADEVRLLLLEAIFRSRVCATKNRVGVGLSVNVRHAPTVAIDRHGASAPLPTLRFRFRGRLGGLPRRGSLMRARCRLRQEK